MSISRRKLPPLNALRAFEVSGRALSFARAAQELGVTQGAVAQQVRALEEHLKVSLFKRLPRGLALTQEGAVYLAKLRSAFDVITEATEGITAKQDVVTISVPPTFAAKVLIPRMGELNAILPDAELRIIATEVIADFDRDQIDLAVRLTRQPFADDLEFAKLFAQDLVAVASPALLNGLTPPLDITQLKSFTILHDAHNHWQKIFRDNEKTNGPKFNQTTLAIDAALSGQGIALSCQAFVEQELTTGRLVNVLGGSIRVDNDYFIVRKKGAHANNWVAQVWQWLLEELSA